MWHQQLQLFPSFKEEKKRRESYLKEKTSYLFTYRRFFSEANLSKSIEPTLRYTLSTSTVDTVLFLLQYILLIASTTSGGKKHWKSQIILFSYLRSAIPVILVHLYYTLKFINWQMKRVKKVSWWLLRLRWSMMPLAASASNMAINRRLCCNHIAQRRPIAQGSKAKARQRRRASNPIYINLQ